MIIRDAISSVIGGSKDIQYLTLINLLDSYCYVMYYCYYYVNQPRYDCVIFAFFIVIS